MCNGGIGHASEQLLHALLDDVVARRFLVQIDESDIDPESCLLQGGIEQCAAPQAIGLTGAATQQHAVDSMADFLLGNGNQELSRRLLDRLMKAVDGA